MLRYDDNTDGHLSYKESRNQADAALDSLREAIIDLMASNRDFNNAIQLSTSSVDNVKLRFDLMRQTVEGVLKDHKIQERCFTRELKQQLFDQNPTCQICKQAIQELDDAAVDHIETYIGVGVKPSPKMPDSHIDIVTARGRDVTELALSHMFGKLSSGSSPLIRFVIAGMCGPGLSGSPFCLVSCTPLFRLPTGAAAFC